jgi:hypothetical protein
MTVHNAGYTTCEVFFHDQFESDRMIKQKYYRINSGHKTY